MAWLILSSDKFYGTNHLEITKNSYLPSMEHKKMYKYSIIKKKNYNKFLIRYNCN